MTLKIMTNCMETALRKIAIFAYKLALKLHKISKPIFTLLPPSWQYYLKQYYRISVAKALFSAFEKIKIEGKAIFYYNDSYNNHICAKNLLAGAGIVGFANGGMGLGHQSRSIFQALFAQNINTCLVDCGFVSYHHNNHHDTTFNEHIKSHNPYRCGIFSVTSNIIMTLYHSLGYKAFKNRYNIHYGAWELAKYPTIWLSSANLMHEFWAMSTFVQQSVQSKVPIPVLFMPYAIDFIIPSIKNRSKFNLPENKFLFIFTFDMSSLCSRKNPCATIKAFQLAFSTKEKDVGLVLKFVTIRDDKKHKAEKQKILKLINNHHSIYVIDKILSDSEIKELIFCCDVYISLHRAEGFGMGMAQAMKMGKPVIATNYSGNTDFTKPETACVVDYKLVPIKPDEFCLYEPGQVWAEPEIEHASEYMKKLYYDNDFYHKTASAGKQFIDQNYNNTLIGQRFLSRLLLLGVI